MFKQNRVSIRLRVVRLRLALLLLCVRDFVIKVGRRLRVCVWKLFRESKSSS